MTVENGDSAVTTAVKTYVLELELRNLEEQTAPPRRAMARRGGFVLREEFSRGYRSSPAG